MPTAILPSVFMPSVNTPSVVLPSVIIPSVGASLPCDDLMRVERRWDLSPTRVWQHRDDLKDSLLIRLETLEKIFKTFFDRKKKFLKRRFFNVNFLTS